MFRLAERQLRSDRTQLQIRATNTAALLNPETKIKKNLTRGEGRQPVTQFAENEQASSNSLAKNQRSA